MPEFVTKDSGQRARFASGMQRDTEEGKARFDLMHPLGVPYDEQFLTRVAKLMSRGAEKYEDRNWESADSEAELARMRSSAARHFEQWLTGETDEDHAAAVVFNLLAHETTAYKMARASSNMLELTEEGAADLAAALDEDGEDDEEGEEGEEGGWLDGDAPEALTKSSDPKFEPFDAAEIAPFIRALNGEIRRIVELYSGPISTEAKLQAAGRDLAERLASKQPRFETDAFDLLMPQDPSPHQQMMAAIRAALRRQHMIYECYAFPNTFVAGVDWREPKTMSFEATKVGRPVIRLVTGQPRFTVDPSGEVTDFDHPVLEDFDFRLYKEGSEPLEVQDMVCTNGVQRSFDRR